MTFPETLFVIKAVKLLNDQPKINNIHATEQNKANAKQSEENITGSIHQTVLWVFLMTFVATFSNISLKLKNTFQFRNECGFFQFFQAQISYVL